MFVCAFVGFPNSERSNSAPSVLITSVEFVVVSHNVKGQKCFAVLKACLKYYFVVLKAPLKYICVFMHTHIKLEVLSNSLFH